MNIRAPYICSTKTQLTFFYDEHKQMEPLGLKFDFKLRLTVWRFPIENWFHSSIFPESDYIYCANTWTGKLASAAIVAANYTLYWGMRGKYHACTEA